MPLRQAASSLRAVHFGRTALFIALAGTACRSDSVQQPATTAVALHIVPSSGAFNVGEQMLFTAERYTTDSTDLGLATGVTWASSDTTVAAMSPDGHFLARCVGHTTITARSVEAGQSVGGQHIFNVSTGGSLCAAAAAKIERGNGRSRSQSVY